MKTEAGLRVEIARLSEEIMQLREMHDLQLQKEAVTQAETQQLREENFDLKGKSTQLLKEPDRLKRSRCNQATSTRGQTAHS